MQSSKSRTFQSCLPLNEVREMNPGECRRAASSRAAATPPLNEVREMNPGECWLIIGENEFGERAQRSPGNESRRMWPATKASTEGSGAQRSPGNESRRMYATIILQAQGWALNEVREMNPGECSNQISDITSFLGAQRSPGNESRRMACRRC